MTISPEDAPHVERLLKAAVEHGAAVEHWFQSSSESESVDDLLNGSAARLCDAARAYAAHKGKKVEDQ